MVWSFLRIAIALAGLAAIITQAAVTFGGAAAEGRDVSTTVANFFSFFTILSNIGAVVVLTWAAIRSWTRRTDGVDSLGLAVTLASVATYMIITGIVYNTLLRFVTLPQGTTVPWSNEVLHVVVPIFLLLDVLFAPGRRALGWRTIWAVLIFPLAWVVYTLVRANLVVNPLSGLPYWYPYPFLDPNNPSGYLSVAAYVIGIAVAIAATAAFVVWVGRRRVLGARSRADAASLPAAGETLA